LTGNQHAGSGSPPLLDSEARNRIRSDLGTSLIVEAAAGTGKTTELVKRIVALFQTGLAQPDQVVAVTFTRRAAGELKLRIRRELEQGLVQSPPGSKEAANLEHAIVSLEEAHIGTIHSFCGELLRTRPVEALIDPGFDELGEEEAEALFDQVVRPWMESAFDRKSPGLERVLSRSSIRENEDFGGPAEQLRNAAWKLAAWRDFPAQWRGPSGDLHAEIDRLIVTCEEVDQLASHCSHGEDPLLQSVFGVRELVTWVHRAERERERDYSRLEALLVALAGPLARLRGSRSGFGRFPASDPRDRILAARVDLADQLERFKRFADADLAVRLQAEMGEVLEVYEAAKRAQGKLDFLDLLIRSRDLLRENREVREFFQARFSHLLVDEFQDTDPLQAEILLLLSADDPSVDCWKEACPKPGKLFLVGDPKQSIYRFRRADTALYLELREELTRKGVALVRLTRNFRSSPSILHLANRAFEPEMKEDPATGQAGYVALDDFRRDLRGQPGVLALPIPDQAVTSWNLTARQLEALQPKLIAAFVHWLVSDSGWRIEDPARPGRLVPIRPGHVAILFRRFVNWKVDVTREYTRELELRAVPHVLVGSRSFHHREEVETIRVALTAVEYPADELSVYATLRGSLFAVPDRHLLWYRSRCGHLNPFGAVQEPGEEPLLLIHRALNFLADLHRRRNQRAYAETVIDLLEHTRAHAGFALRPAGHQVLANVERLVDLIRSFEVAGGVSFRAMLNYLENLKAGGGAESPVVEEAVDGVRVMTVHAAKGLEFPVVILADLTCKMSLPRSDCHVDPARRLAAFSLLGCRPLDLLEWEDFEAARDRAEGIRIAYVAATRARDLLVVPVTGRKPWEGWVQPLNKAFYPTREPRLAEDRPDQVIWWDTRSLNLDVDADFGVRQAEILAEDDDRTVAARGLEDYRAWVAQVESLRSRGTRKSMEVRIVTDLAETESPPDPVPIRIARIPAEGRRPSGRRFGTLVHTLLRDVELALSGEDAIGLARFHGRLLAATDEEIAMAAEVVQSALLHPLVIRAAASDECRREWPILLNRGDRRLLEGTIDLAFREGDVWVVVDFKTDLGRSSDLEKKVRQVQWYASALGQVTGSPVEGWILGI